MNKVKVGIAGVGHLGKYHWEKSAQMPDVALVGMAEILLERRKAISRQYDISWYEDYHRLIPKIAAVSIVVPTILHARVAKDFLHHRIDALIEKPISRSPVEAEELISLAKTKELSD